MRDNVNLTGFVDLLAERTKPKPKKFAELLLAKQEEAVALALEEAPGPRQVEEKDVVADSMHKNKKPKARFEPLGQNVKILQRRETEVSREMDVGRWKVIERELGKRGLPVYPARRSEAKPW